MKAAVLDGVPNLPILFVVLVYDINTVHFILLCYNTFEWVYKTWQVYDPKTEVVWDVHFLRLNVNYSYNHNRNSVDLSDQLQNMY